MKNFQNTVALITGAGSGIGRALAEELSDQGCSLALVDWNNESLQETKEIVRKKNISVSTHAFDISDRDKITELPQKVLDLHNQIDIVINTTETRKSIDDSFSIRRTALIRNIPYFLTVSGARAGINSIKRLKVEELSVNPISYFH